MAAAVAAVMNVSDALAQAPLPWEVWSDLSAQTVDLALRDLFGAGGATPIRSLWLRASTGGELTSFFPMSYRRTASLALTKDQGASVTVDFRIRVDESQTSGSTSTG